MDKRRHYIIVLDTETCNTIDSGGVLDMSNCLVYDCGFCIMDTRGNVYEEHSYLINEIFLGEKVLMTSAYYASKLPEYWKDIWAKKRTLIDFRHLKNIIRQKMEEYGITEVCAHNAKFDRNALNTTERYLTGSKYRFFFPYGTVMWDSMNMARSVMMPMPSYKKFCETNGFMTAGAYPRPRLTAEVLYRFIIKDPTFTESHTGLEDVRIEREIVTYCYRQKKSMKKTLFQKICGLESPLHIDK